MFSRISVYFIFLLFLGACSHDQLSVYQQKKSQFQQVIEKEFEKKERTFLLIQQGDHVRNVFDGYQYGENWTLHHKIKEFKIEKTGNKVLMSAGNKKEILTSEQFGIISPREHLDLVRASDDTTRISPDAMINHKKVNHVTITVNENKLASILKSRFKISDSPDLSRYLSGKFQVIYDLYYSSEMQSLIKFETKISSSEKKNTDSLTYWFNDF